MPKTKIILDEKMICDEYINTKTGIETMALKYHVGKLKIRQILNKNGIEIKKRGGQSDDNTFLIEDYHIKKYVDNEQYHYEVFYDEETLNVPADLIPEGKTIADIIQSEQLMTKKNHPNSEDKEGTMLFGQSEDDITLSIDNSDYTFTFKVKPMNSESTKEILVEGNTFTMPAEAVLVYDITIEKKVEKYIAKH